MLSQQNIVINFAWEENFVCSSKVLILTPYLSPQRSSWEPACWWSCLSAFWWLSQPFLLGLFVQLFQQNHPRTITPYFKLCELATQLLHSSWWMRSWSSNADFIWLQKSHNIGAPCMPFMGTPTPCCLVHFGGCLPLYFHPFHISHIHVLLLDKA